MLNEKFPNIIEYSGKSYDDADSSITLSVEELEKMDLAGIGKNLIASGKGTVTPYGIVFDNDVDKTPEKALSVGVETVTDAKEVLLVINGHNKAAALAATVEGPVSAKVTCSALQMHKNAIIACDEPACGELKVDTYKYFLDIEKSQRL